MLGTATVITLEAAKKMVAAGEAEATTNGWNVAITVVDAGGALILFQKLDDTQPGSIAISQGKARTAASTTVMATFHPARANTIAWVSKPASGTPVVVPRGRSRPRSS